MADPQAIDRAGFVALLGSQPDLEVIGEPVTTEEVISTCRHLHPSLILLSLTLPAPPGVTPIAAIRARVPEIPILAVAERSETRCVVLNPPGLTGAEHHDRSERCTAGTDCLELAVAEGATGTIRRTAAPEDLFLAIRTVAAGKAWYEAGTAAAIMRHALARHGDTGTTKTLSSREIEVGRLIADGRSNKEIAQALGISEPTVKKHVGHILGKLKLQDRLQVGIHLTRNPLVLRVAGDSRR